MFTIPVGIERLPDVEVRVTVSLESEVGQDFLRLWGQRMADENPLRLPTAEDFREFVEYAYNEGGVVASLEGAAVVVSDDQNYPALDDEDGAPTLRTCCKLCGKEAKGIDLFQMSVGTDLWLVLCGPCGRNMIDENFAVAGL